MRYFSVVLLLVLSVLLNACAANSAQPPQPWMDEQNAFLEVRMICPKRTLTLSFAATSRRGTPTVEDGGRRLTCRANENGEERRDLALTYCRQLARRATSEGWWHSSLRIRSFTAYVNQLVRDEEPRPENFQSAVALLYPATCLRTYAIWTDRLPQPS